MKIGCVKCVTIPSTITQQKQMQYSKMQVLRNSEKYILHTIWFKLTLLRLQICAAYGVLENARQNFFA